MTNTDTRGGAHRQSDERPQAAHPYGPYGSYGSSAPQQGPWSAPQGGHRAPQPGPWGPPPQQFGPSYGHPAGPAPAPVAPKKAKKWPWALGALGLLVVIGAASGGGETTAPTATAPAAPAASAASAPASAPAAATDTSDSGSSYGQQTARFGQQVQAGDVAVTAQKPKKRTQEFIGTQYCSSVTLKNTGSSPESFSPFDWKFRTAEGVEASANVPFNASKPLNSGSLRPGGTVTGEVCSDTDTDGVTELVYSPGFGIMHQVTFGS